MSLACYIVLEREIEGFDHAGAASPMANSLDSRFASVSARSQLLVFAETRFQVEV